MATDKLSVYLQVNGASEAEKRLKNLGRNGSVALDGVTASVKPVNAALLAMNSTVGQVSGTFNKFAGIAGAYLGFQGIKGTVSGIIATNTEFQKLSASLEVVEKDAERAAVILDKLDQLAVQTPYSVQSLTDAWIKLGALGLKPSEEALISYGNTSSAMGKDIMQFIEAIADASSNEFERLKEFGIKAKQQGDEVSFTFQGITTTVKKNADDIEKYLRNIGQTTFAGSMTKQMATIAGSVSNLGDNFARIQRTVGESGFNEALKNFYGSVSEVVASSEDSAKGLGSILGAVTNGATLLVNNLDVLGDAALAFAGFKTIKSGSTIAISAINATSLAAKNMAFALSTSSAIVGKAATAQIAAMTAMSKAAKGLSSAMGLVGGPLGVIAIAGFSIYEYAKKSDIAADSSSKYAEELKEVEKNSKSLKQATDDLTASQSKQTKLTLLSNIDDVKADIIELKDQLMNTNYSDVGFFGALFGTASADVEQEIIKLKTQMNEGEISIDEFVGKMRKLGESNIDFRQPALKAVEISNTLKAAELALDNYQNKLNTLDSNGIDEQGSSTDNKTAEEFKEIAEEVNACSLSMEELKSKSTSVKDLMGNLNVSSNWLDGIKSGLEDVKNESLDLASTAEKALKGAFSAMEDSLVDFIKTGKLNFSDFANSIIDGLLRIQIQQSIIQPLSKGLSSYFGTSTSSTASTSVSANVSHTGGLTTGVITRQVPTDLFANAPRYHTGSIINKDEQPAILLKGEGVVDRQTMNSLLMENKRSNNQVFNINIENNSSGGSDVETSISQNSNGANINVVFEQFENMLANNLGRNRGPLNNVLNNRFKLNGANL